MAHCDNCGLSDGIHANGCPRSEVAAVIPSRRSELTPDTIIAEGRPRYGSVRLQSAVWEQLLVVLEGTPKFKKLPCYMRQSLRMIMLKISRICVGEQDQPDSWNDIGGYAMLAHRSMTEVNSVYPREGQD